MVEVPPPTFLEISVLIGKGMDAFVGVDGEEQEISPDFLGLSPQGWRAGLSKGPSVVCHLVSPGVESLFNDNIPKWGPMGSLVG